MKKWKIFIVTANDIYDEFYEKGPFFSPEHFSFFNVSSQKLSHSKFDVINAIDIAGYKFLGKDYAESEVIYNIGKLNLFSDYDFIGILHYDFNFYNKHYDTYKVTENIRNILSGGFKWISFFSAPFSSIYGYYNVLLDERRPNCLFVRDSGLENPKNANDYALNLINKKFGIDFNLAFLKEQVPVSLCCSFLTTRKIFQKLSEVIQESIDDGHLDSFDTQHRHRLPGQVFERVAAVFSTLYNKFDFTLDHKFIGGRKINREDENGENY